jgi:LPXTG-site transpeptidase (sortase) family protein
MKRPAGFIAVLLLCALVAGLLLYASTSGLETIATGGADDPPQPDVATRQESAAVRPAPSRIVAHAIGLDAPIVVLGLDEQQAMETPDRPDVVAWYDFSPLPGEPGNAVFAGHVDFHGWGPAVFWDLSRLRPGDEVAVLLEDGRRLAYRVAESRTYEFGSAPIDSIVGQTADEVVTLLTCSGTFDPRTRTYYRVLVVKAARI